MHPHRSHLRSYRAVRLKPHRARVIPPQAIMQGGVINGLLKNEIVFECVSESVLNLCVEHCFEQLFGQCV